MSEIGPIKVRFCFFWRIISWLAANGIIDSSAQPIAIDMPFSMSRAMASRSEQTLSIERFCIRSTASVQLESLRSESLRPASRNFIDRSAFSSLLSAEFLSGFSAEVSLMFCTHCGTQVEEGKNFCRNCGTRIGKASDAAPDEPAAPRAPEQRPVAQAEFSNTAEPATVPRAQERQGLGAATIVGGC